MIRVNQQQVRPVPGLAFGSTSEASALPSFDFPLTMVTVRQSLHRSTLRGCFRALQIDGPLFDGCVGIQLQKLQQHRLNEF